MLSVNKKSQVYVTWWHLGSSALQKFALSEKLWRCVQSTQLCELSLTKWDHVQKSRVKVNDQGKRITLWELERRCQLVIRLKANKCYQELLCYLSSYINLLNLLNLKASAVGSWPLAGSRPLAPDPDLWPTLNLWRCLYLLSCLVNCSLVRPVAIRPLSDELLALSQSDRARISCWTSVDGSWLFACVNLLAHWLLELQAVQDKIYLQIDCALISDHPPRSRWTI